MKDKLITLVFILLIGVLLQITLNYLAENSNKDDCVIGRESADCLDGNSGHPLYQN